MVSIGINAVGMVVVLLGEASVGISYKKFLNSVYVEDTKELRLIYESIGTSGQCVITSVIRGVVINVISGVIASVIGGQCHFSVIMKL